jgi:DNA/RNA-binding domain of Phe-tRNA-synthetase-like protein
MMQVSEAWKQFFPGAGVGVMALDQVSNPAFSEALETEKRLVEAELRAKFADRQELLDSTILKAYTDYYKKFAKTYHVQQQLESVIFKGKSIPAVAGLVEAMFMAELKNGLLTAGHDYQTLQLPLTLDVASQDEQYILMNGKEQAVKPGDMRISDMSGVISSIIHGPDQRTRITTNTQKAFYVVYAPPGIDHKLVLQHLSDIHRYVKLFAPGAQMIEQQVFS